MDTFVGEGDLLNKHMMAILCSFFLVYYSVENSLTVNCRELHILFLSNIKPQVLESFATNTTPIL